MKKTVLFSVLALTASAFADGEMIAAAQKGQPQQVNYSSNGNTTPASPVTLTSARLESDNGWYLFANALYWHADVGSTVKDMNFDWDWGFKVGIGINMDHDMWDSNLYYTWFRTKLDNTVSKGLLGESVVKKEIYDIDASTAKAKMKWDINFSMLDWELGRWHYLSKNLAVRPHVGLKGGWINHKLHVHQDTNLSVLDFTVTSQAANKYKGDSGNIGPSAGINTLWILTHAGSDMQHRFSLVGDFSGSLMYSHFKLRNHPIHNAGTTAGNENSIKKLNQDLASTMLQGLIGLSWDTDFNRGRNHFMVKAGYEIQYWFKQNHGFQAIDKRIADSDLALQGANLEFRFDF